MGFWRDLWTVGRSLRSGLVCTKLTMLNAGGTQPISATDALEAARTGE